MKRQSYQVVRQTQRAYALIVDPGYKRTSMQRLFDVTWQRCLVKMSLTHPCYPLVTQVVNDQAGELERLKAEIRVLKSKGPIKTRV